MMQVAAASVSQGGDEEGGGDGNDENDGKKDPIQGGPYTVAEEELKAQRKALLRIESWKDNEVIISNFIASLEGYEDPPPDARGGGRDRDGSKTCQDPQQHTSDSYPGSSSKSSSGDPSKEIEENFAPIILKDPLGEQRDRPDKRISKKD